MDATVTQPFTPSSPAKIEIGLQNLASDPRDFEVGPTTPFSWYWGAGLDSAAELVLVPDDLTAISVVDENEDGEFTLVPDSPDDDCWKVPDRLVSDSVGTVATLEPCETVTRTYLLLAASDSEGCLEPGEYRFEDESYFEDGTPWGFTVTLGSAGA